MPLKENEASKNKHTRQICPFTPSLENVILLAIPCDNSKPCLMNARQPVDYFNYSSDLSLSTAQSVPSNLCSIPQRNNNRQDGIRGLIMPLSAIIASYAGSSTVPSTCPLLPRPACLWEGTPSDSNIWSQAVILCVLGSLCNVCYIV